MEKLQQPAVDILLQLESFDFSQAYDQKILPSHLLFLRNDNRKDELETITSEIYTERLAQN